MWPFRTTLAAKRDLNEKNSKSVLNYLNYFLIGNSENIDLCQEILQ